jgi:DNA polymerase-1
MSINSPYLILDANYLSHRAKHIFGGLRDAGEATGVVYGFLRDLLTLRERFNTNRFVFCWDSPTSKRKEILSTYKQHRVKEWTEEEQEFDRMFRKQIAKLKHKYLHTIGYRNIFWQDSYEADDIIAAVCQSLVPGGLDEGIIVTADRDLFQCIRSNISWYNPRTKTCVSKKHFIKRFGIKPKQWVKIKAIAGCNSDNVKGVPGVGEVTALLYIRGLLKKDSKKYQAIKTHWKDIVLFNRQLVELPLKGVKPIRLVRDEVTQEGWNKVTKKLGMKSIRYRSTI